jgi:hypothetical protein
MVCMPPLRVFFCLMERTRKFGIDSALATVVLRRSRSNALRSRGYWKQLRGVEAL